MLERAIMSARRATISALRHLVKNHSYIVRRGIAKGLKRKGGLGFISLTMSLPSEEKFLMDLDFKGQTVYDIGGFEGVFTLFFARAVGEKGRVITFEPHPENCKKILDNVKLNNFDNIEVRQIALGKKRGKMSLAFRDSELESSSLQEDMKIRILEKRKAKTILVEVDTLNGQITGYKLPKPDFVKIDVIGVEVDVLLGMGETIKHYKPKLFVEIFGVDLQSKIKNAQRVMNFLIPNGYSIYHVESMKTVTSFDIANVGMDNLRGLVHLYCTYADKQDHTSGKVTPHLTKSRCLMKVLLLTQVLPYPPDSAPKVKT